MLKKKASKKIYLRKEELRNLQGKQVFILRLKDIFFIMNSEEFIDFERRAVAILSGKERKDFRRFLYARLDEIYIKEKIIRVSSYLTKGL